MLGGFELDHPLSAFASAPMLKAVELTGQTFNFRLPWSQITRLSLDPFEDDSWGTLAICEELVELHLRVLTRGVHADSVVILKKVEILQLTNYEFVDQVLDVLKLPALRDFTCLATCTPDTFTSFSTRSGFNVSTSTKSQWGRHRENVSFGFCKILLLCHIYLSYSQSSPIFI